MSAANGAGPVVFAYDGSDLAKLAIDEAGRQVAVAGAALVVCVWQPFDVGFVLGSHGRSGLADVLLGSVAGAVAAHSRRSVLISHRRS